VSLGSSPPLGSPCGYRCDDLQTSYRRCAGTLVPKYRAGRLVIRTALRTLGPDPHGEVERWQRRRLLSTFAGGRTYGVTMRYSTGRWELTGDSMNMSQTKATDLLEGVLIVAATIEETTQSGL
jgi:hypothetical protein